MNRGREGPCKRLNITLTRAILMLSVYRFASDAREQMSGKKSDRLINRNIIVDQFLLGPPLGWSGQFSTRIFDHLELDLSDMEWTPS